MTPPDLSRLVTAVFVRHLAAEHNASPHTTKSYRDALKLLLRFAADACHRQAAGLQIDDLTPDFDPALSHRPRNDTPQFRADPQRTPGGGSCSRTLV